MSDSLTAVVAAGGNSRAARSLRARLQWRDRYGRWIEMGRGIKFDVRLGDGSSRSVVSKFVGAINENTGQVYVENDANLPDGFYNIDSKNATEIIADLGPEDLARRNIQVGRDSQGNAVSAREATTIPTIAELTRYDAPEGFRRESTEARSQGVEKFVSTDGDITIIKGHTFNRETNSRDSFWGLNIEGDTPEGQYQRFNQIGGVFNRINDSDENGPEADAPEADAQIPDAPEAETPEAPTGPTSGEYELRGVSAEGFLIPTGKRGDSTPEGLAALMEQERDFLGEGGKRLVYDRDGNSVEIYNSAASLEDAKAQAGGIGADHYVDLSTGERIENDKNVGAPNGDGSTGGDPNEARSTDSVESEGDDAGAASGVREDSRVPGAPAERPAVDRESREYLEQQRDRLNEQWSNTRNERARDRIDRQLDEVERKLAELDEPSETPERAEEPTPEREEAPEPAPETPDAPEEPEPSPEPAEERPAAETTPDSVEESLEEMEGRLERMQRQFEVAFERGQNPDALDRIDAQIRELQRSIDDRSGDVPEEPTPTPEPEATPEVEPAPAPTPEVEVEPAPTPDIRAEVREALEEFRAENVPTPDVAPDEAESGSAVERAQANLDTFHTETHRPTGSYAGFEDYKRRERELEAKLIDAEYRDGLISEQERNARIDQLAQIAVTSNSRRNADQIRHDLYREIGADLPSPVREAPTPRGLPSNAPSVRTNALKAEAMSKEGYEDFIDRLDFAGNDRDRLDELANEITAAPNRPNTGTVPREDARPELTEFQRELLARENDPEFNVTTNVIMDGIRAMYPESEPLANGDIKIGSRSFNGREYAVIVRRTENERFFSYVLETDYDTGVQRAVRPETDAQSLRALTNKINAQLKTIQEGKNPRRFVNNSSPQRIGDGQLDVRPLNNLIDGTMLTISPDEAQTRLIGSYVDLIENHGLSRDELLSLGEIQGQSPEFVDMVLESVRRRQIFDSQSALYDNSQNYVPHRDANGAQIREGDWVDWVDTDETVPERDAEGNVVYDVVGGKRVARNVPNPDYMKVYRTQVVRVEREAIGHSGQYAYSDNVILQIADRSRDGRARQQQYTAKNMKVVESENAPASEPFNGRVAQSAPESVTARGVFRFPSSPDEDKPTPAAPESASVSIDDNGVPSLAGYEDVRVPFSAVEAAAMVEDGTPRSSRTSSLEPGDLIVRLDDNGAPQYDAVLSVEGADGETRVRTFNPSDREIRERVMDDVQVTSFRPAPEEAPEAPASVAPESVDDYVAGDIVDVYGVGQAEIVEPPTDNQPAFRVRDIAGDIYFIPRDEMPTRGPEDEKTVRVREDTRQMILDVANRRVIDVEHMEVIAMALASGNAAPVSRLRELLAEIESAPVRDTSAPGELFSFDRALTRRLRNEGIDLDVIESIITTNNWRQARRSPAQQRLVEQYAGERFRALTARDIRVGAARSPFEDLGRVHMADVKEGDVLVLGYDRFAQVVSNDGRGNNVKVRFITSRGQGYVIGGRGRQFQGSTMENFSRRNPQVLRPTEFMPRSYRNDRAPLAAMDTDAATDARADIMLDGVNARGARLRQSYLEEYTSGEAPEGEGVMHAVAEFGTGGGNTPLFIKQTQSHSRFRDLTAARQASNELLANRVAHMVGLDKVDMDRVGDDLLVMTPIDGELAIQDGDLAEDLLGADFWETSAWRIGIMDYIIGNGDRHPENWLIDRNGNPVPIDHGNITWSRWDSNSSEFSARMLQDLYEGNAPLTSATLLQMHNRLNALAPMFAAEGMRDEFNRMMTRLDRLGVMVTRRPE